ncbi:MAG: hypothetical protein WC622_16655, partial [Pedobacter sp.]|uniref:hypothetical protein n=1 Tax=Pedobacter sp. TaxID=1411316 RepID=UPI003566D99E
MEIEILIKAINRNSELQEKILLKLDKLCDFVSNHMTNNNLSESLVDKDKVKEIYKISESTLYRSKKKNQITPIKVIGDRDYYRVEEI